MSDVFKRPGILLLALLLGACAGRQQTVLTPVPVEDRSVENIDFGNHQGGTGSTHDERQAGANNHQRSKQAGKSTLDKPMLTALLEDVDVKLKLKNDKAAAATLERALRLDAKNAILWHRLAQIRLQQKNWQQTLNLAKKSNSLAAGDYVLQLENWKLIYLANEAAGEHDAAEFARSRVRELELKLP